MFADKNLSWKRPKCPNILIVLLVPCILFYAFLCLWNLIVKKKKNWSNNLIYATTGGLYLESSIVSISMSSDHREESTISFFFHLINQIRSIVGAIETWGEYTDFIFQGIRRWPVINLLPLMQGYSHSISLETVVGNWELQETQVNINGLLEKPDITYLSRNS